MDGNRRRGKMLQILEHAREPIKGNQLAADLGVSRQVIVQDIALLRVSDKNIISTTKGYILYKQNEDKASRIYMVSHTDDEIQDELNIIVDCGGKVLDVVIEHEVYGSIAVDLMLSSRRDIKQFIENIKDAKPLMSLTKGNHMHTVEADNEKILDAIEAKLYQNGYLIK